VKAAETPIRVRRVSDALLQRIHPNIQLALFDSLDELWDPAPEYWDEHLRHLEQHTPAAQPTAASDAASVAATEVLAGLREAA